MKLWQLASPAQILLLKEVEPLVYASLTTVKRNAVMDMNSMKLILGYLSNVFIKGTDKFVEVVCEDGEEEKDILSIDTVEEMLLEKSIHCVHIKKKVYENLEWIYVPLLPSFIENVSLTIDDELSIAHGTMTIELSRHIDMLTLNLKVGTVLFIKNVRYASYVKIRTFDTVNHVNVFMQRICDGYIDVRFSYMNSSNDLYIDIDDIITMEFRNDVHIILL